MGWSRCRIVRAALDDLFVSFLCDQMQLLLIITGFPSPAVESLPSPPIVAVTGVPSRYISELGEHG